MRTTPAEIFRASGELDSFRRELTALDGEFDFASPDMIALGEAYFERHPDRSVGRDTTAVLLGYALVRACAVEKAVRGLSPAGRRFYRAALLDVSRVGPLVEERRASESPEELRREADEVGAALDAIKRTIEEIPKGMIRERFIGGISNLYNILYMVRMKLKDG
jgi:hypothetical protein